MVLLVRNSAKTFELRTFTHAMNANIFYVKFKGALQTEAVFRNYSTEQLQKSFLWSFMKFEPLNTPHLNLPSSGVNNFILNSRNLPEHLLKSLLSSQLLCKCAVFSSLCPHSALLTWLHWINSIATFKTSTYITNVSTGYQISTIPTYIRRTIGSS